MWYTINSHNNVTTPFRSYVVGYNFSNADKTALNAVLVAVGGLPNKEVRKFRIKINIDRVL